MATHPSLQFLDSVVKMPLMALPVRSVVVAVGDAKILISPGSQLTREQLESAGAITDIVAPNLFHCAGMARACGVFPDAKVWGPPGARRAKPAIRWTHLFGESSWPFQDELALIPLDGLPRFQEHVFHHVPSRSLIVTDLCFNMRNAQGLGARVILGLFGTYNKFGVSRLFMRFVRDREAFERSLGRVLALDFQDIIVSHGEIATSGKDRLLHALSERGVTPKMG